MNVVFYFFVSFCLTRDLILKHARGRTHVLACLAESAENRPIDGLLRFLVAIFPFFLAKKGWVFVRLLLSFVVFTAKNGRARRK